MQPRGFNAPNASAAFLPFALLLAGFVLSPFFFAFALLAFGARIAKTNKALGLGVGALGLVYLMLLFGYGMGKDLALRDNARQTSQVSLGSP